MDEYQRIDDLLVMLATEQPDLATDIGEVRAYLRDLQPQAQLRQLLRDVVEAIAASSALAPDLRATLREVESLLLRLVEAEEAQAEVQTRTADRRWEGVRGVSRALVRAAKSPPAYILWASIAWAVAHWLGVTDHLLGGSP